MTKTPITHEEWIQLDRIASAWWETYVDPEAGSSLHTVRDPDEARAELTAMLVRLRDVIDATS